MMDDTEIGTLTALEDRHWWYAARRGLLRRAVGPAPAGAVALDVGAAGGGNTRVLADLGWSAVALEYSDLGTRITRSRGVQVARSDAHRLPVASGVASLVTALDVLEHLADDGAAAAELHRVLRPGGRLFVAVPADPDLWSAHDEAVGHLRRYTRDELVRLVGGAGFRIDDVWSWNVLLRPVVARRRQTSEGSDLAKVPLPLNVGLRVAVELERFVPPIRRRRGVSLVVEAVRAA